MLNGKKMVKTKLKQWKSAVGKIMKSGCICMVHDFTLILHPILISVRRLNYLGFLPCFLNYYSVGTPLPFYNHVRGHIQKFPE